ALPTLSNSSGLLLLAALYGLALHRHPAYHSAPKGWLGPHATYAPAHTVTYTWTYAVAGAGQGVGGTKPGVRMICAHRSHSQGAPRRVVTSSGPQPAIPDDA